MKKLTQKIKKGFTLVELMIVVAIIGILSAIAIPNFIKFQARSKQSEARTNLKAIYTAETVAIGAGGRYQTLTGAGFIPERGNRYWYHVNSTVIATQKRETAAMLDPTAASSDAYFGGGFDSYDVDCFRIAGGLAGCTPQPTAGGVTAITAITPVPNVGITAVPATPGMTYKEGEGAVVRAIGNIDTDKGSDTWDVGLEVTLPVTTGPCTESVQGVAGVPVNVWNDVSCS
jgi:type IV pilus assembly protein PilA